MSTARDDDDFCHTLHSLSIAVARLQENAKAHRVALRLQAREYERRLEEANNAIARADRLANTYATRELHDRLAEQLHSKSAELKEQINELRADLSSWQGRLLMLAYVITAVVSITSVSIAVWHLFHA